MGKYTIVISGEGKHHSEDDQQTDANKVALDFVSWLKKEGHIVHSAIFNHADNTKTDDLHAMTEPSEASEPVDLSPGTPVDAGQGEGAPSTGAVGDPNAPPPPLPMKIYSIEAEGDTVYVQAMSEDEAKHILDKTVGGVMPDILTVIELPGLPVGAELLNPTADDEVSEVEGQGTSG